MIVIPFPPKAVTIQSTIAKLPALADGVTTLLHPFIITCAEALLTATPTFLLPLIIVMPAPEI